VAGGFRREIGLVIGWLAFPLVPVLLEDTYYSLIFFPDPRGWGWFEWIIMLGPLVGFGFLAGATLDLPDPVAAPGRFFRRMLVRRSLWVAVGPWCGFLAWMSGYFLSTYVRIPVGVAPQPSAPNAQGANERSVAWTWALTALGWCFVAFFWGTLAYGWLLPAWAVLRRARRIGRLARAFYRGLAVAAAFVGSLFGTFWSATAIWRSYFFDPRIVPILIVGLSLILIGGCSSRMTVGEVRRREFFHALLVAWVLGLALMWRWWARKRR
jgi:hypothetical protein